MTKPITPLLAVDIIIGLTNEDQQGIVLIERRHPPFGWAIPGGFVDVGETVEQAAVREAKEETNLSVQLIHLLGVYSDPNRDPRGHTVSIVYTAVAQGIPSAQDDAKTVHVFHLDELPGDLAFDHKMILQDYIFYREGLKP